MKQIGLTFLLIVFAASAGLAQDSAGSDDIKKATPVIQFDTTTYNFGRIEYNGNGTCNFNFTNTGEEPLLLNRVRASCGCTSPSWPKKPIKPGETGKITVKYNTRIEGSFSKSVMVYSNAQNSPVVLRIKGKVASPN
jgi:hypothetical protein